MKRFHPFYFLRRAVANLRGAPRPAAVTASTIATAVFLLGGFVLLGSNVHRTLVGWAGQGDPLVVYAKRGMTPAATDALARRIQSLPEVARVRVIPPDEGMKDLRRTLGDDAEVLDGIDAREVLPAAMSIGLRDASLDRSTAGFVAQKLRQIDGVDSVDSETAWLERFSKIGRVFVWIGLGWATILGLGTLLVVGNSTRLAALTRKDEIEVLRLVGASDAFILVPFFLEGAIQGIGGSIGGLAALGGAFFALVRALGDDSFFAPFVTGLRFLEPRILIALLVAGPVVGAIGAAGSARRFLRGVEL
jgi:cell division transport system permease protein